MSIVALASRQERNDDLARDIRRLQSRAGDRGHAFLAYLLAMAADEAETIAAGPTPRPRPFWS